MYHRRRKKMRHFIINAILLLGCSTALSKSVDSTKEPIDKYDNSFDNNIIDFDEDLSVKYNKNPWHTQEYFNKESHRYTIDNDFNKNKEKDKIIKRNETQAKLETSTLDYSVIPLELTSTTDSLALSNLESTTEQDLTVIPLKKIPPTVDIKATIEPATTENVDITTYFTELSTFTTNADIDTSATEFYNSNESSESTKASTVETTTDIFNTTESSDERDKLQIVTKRNKENIKSLPITSGGKDEIKQNVTIIENSTTNKTSELVKSINITKVHKIKIINTNGTKAANVSKFDDLSSELEDTDVPIFTELDTEEEVEVPEDYYDSKDVVPTTAPKTDALSIIFGLAGSVVESVVETVAEKVVPKGIVDLFRRMQRQSEALEAEKLRSREENGGIGQFGRGLLKSISTGLSVPLSQLMAGVRDIGSLDNDRGFVTSVASSVTSVAKQATEVLDAFKDKVHAIYPGTVWCGDGRSATARSSDLGLFFFTDTCCRQHDACKIYIRAGETKYGLTNTGLFTRSHCSCDAKFRDCLRRTNSLVSAQIGLTYFNVLGPQCFRKAHPIVKCVKKTRITGLKCEEYELDYSKPRMWQWFDNETF